MNYGGRGIELLAKADGLVFCSRSVSGKFDTDLVGAADIADIDRSIK